MKRSTCTLGAVALMGLSCDRNLDTLDGHDLGQPTSAVFSRDDNGHVMVVMSNLTDLCQTLAEADSPTTDDFWVLSAWTHVGVDEPDEYAVEAYVAVSTNQEIEEYDTEAGGMTFSRLDADMIKGRLDITFPGNDRVKAHITADYCEADLFVGMY